MIAWWCSNDGGPIIPTIFDFLYREYCRARLAEMRKQLLLVSAESHEVPEANCDVSHPGGSGCQDSGSSDERTYDCRLFRPSSDGRFTSTPAEHGYSSSYCRSR